MRVQIHKLGEKVWIFTRRLEDVTHQFPEIVEGIRKGVRARKCLLEGEAIGYDPRTGKAKPFQELSKRIKRKYGIEEIAKQIPTETHLFDLLYLDGKSLLKKKFSQRRRLLEEIQKSPTYPSGFALRFPRLIRLRLDRAPADADTKQRVIKLYQSQKA
jgi:DNA ligase-1